MSVSTCRKEIIFNRWDTIEEMKKNRLFNEFKLKQKGFYTQRDFLQFLERKLFKKTMFLVEKCQTCTSRET